MGTTLQKQQQYWNTRTLKRLRGRWHKHRQTLEQGSFRRIRRLFRKHSEQALLLLEEALPELVGPDIGADHIEPRAFFNVNTLKDDLFVLMGEEYFRAIEVVVSDIVWHIKRMQRHEEEWRQVHVELSSAERERMAQTFLLQRQRDLEGIADETSAGWEASALLALAAVETRPRKKVIGEIRNTQGAKNKHRAQLVSRTENAQAIGWARNRIYMEEDFFEMLVWSSVVDNLTRHSHRRINGTAVKKGEFFPNGLRYPGDPIGPLQEIANCRCDFWARPATEEERNADAAQS